MMSKAQWKRFNAARGKIEQGADELRNLHADLMASFDDRSDKWRESDKGIAQSDALSELDGAISEIESGKDALPVEDE